MVRCNSLPDSNRIISRLSTLDPFQLVTPITAYNLLRWFA
nr:MAG TPA: hypothetical protein [Caudoviricetes sp.]DAR73452.1 MAG TPA: hypothetical protein [Caudoviricetes sp.]